MVGGLLLRPLCRCARGRTTAFLTTKRFCSVVAITAKGDDSVAPCSVERDPLLEPEPILRERLGLLKEVTYALAPPEYPTVELPTPQLHDLNELYEVLMRPLAPLPTREERLEKLHHIEALDSTAFFEQRDFFDPEAHAFRIRCLGAQGHPQKAHEVFRAMLYGIDGAPQPDLGCFHAYADAFSRAADTEGVEAVIELSRSRGMGPTAPMYTSLVGAHRRARTPNPPAVCRALLQDMRSKRVIEDAPLHTAIICWQVASGLTEEAWRAYEQSRRDGVDPDAVTFTAMLVACAQADKLELACNLLDEMRLFEVNPTLATHNAFINVCAARSASLAELSRRQHAELRRLAVEVDVLSPVRLADQTLQTLLGEGHRPDAHTYMGLLRVAAGAADVRRAQSLLTRMLDLDLTPTADHFHTLLRACVRAQRLRPNQSSEGHLRVALTVLPSMEALEVPIGAATIDLILKAYTDAHRIYRSVEILDHMYDAYGLAPAERSFGLALRMAARLRRPQLAADILERMQARGQQHLIRRIPSQLKEQEHFRKRSDTPRTALTLTLSPSVQVWCPRQLSWICRSS